MSGLGWPEASAPCPRLPRSRDPARHAPAVLVELRAEPLAQLAFLEHDALPITWGIHAHNDAELAVANAVRFVQRCAGLALAGGLISYVAGRGVGRYVVTAIGCLAVSGVTRLLEFWIAQGGGGIS